MSMPIALNEQVALELMDHDRKWQVAMSDTSPGGREITDGEARLIRLHLVRQVVPPIVDLLDTVGVARSMFSTQRGVCGDRTIRRIKAVWRLRAKPKAETPPLEAA